MANVVACCWKGLHARTSARYLYRYANQDSVVFACKKNYSSKFTNNMRRYSDSAKSDSSDALSDTVKPTNFQKRVLVWAKMYKSVEEVPERVTANKIRKSRDFFRIKVNISMGIMTLLGCLFWAMYGKHLARSGDSLDARGKAQIEEWARKGEEERKQQK